MEIFLVTLPSKFNHNNITLRIDIIFFIKVNKYRVMIIRFHNK